MTLKLYFHPLSSFSWKGLIPLYENATPFEPMMLSPDHPENGAEFGKLWPVGQFPLLVDTARDHVIPESSIIIEYLDQHYPGPVRFIPEDPDLARQTRLRDRFFDLHMQVHMQRIVTDNLRPKGQNDSYGVESAKKKLRVALDMVDQDLANKQWAMGDTFSMADIAALPALFYTNMLSDYGATHKNAAAYLERLKARPAFARVLKEAEPYFAMVPI
jgi:glutathione S-transferase